MKDVEELSLVYLWTKDSLFQKIDKMNLSHNTCTCTSWVQVHLYIILPTIHPEYVTAPGILRFPIFRTPFRKTIDIYKLTVKERWTPVKQMNQAVYQQWLSNWWFINYFTMITLGIMALFYLAIGVKISPQVNTRMWL